MRVWREPSFHAIGVSEVFEIDYPAQTVVQIKARRQEILDEVVAAFNAVDDAQLRGQVDGHCFYLWHSSLGLAHADFSSLGVTNQPWRKAQHLCFYPADSLVPMHVYHLHSPSPGKKKIEARQEVDKAKPKDHCFKPLSPRVPAAS